VQLTLVSSSLSCNGDCDASATVTAAGGTVSGDYTYNWSTGGTANSIAGLCAGTYSVTVTDDDGCIADTTFTIANPPAISISVDVVAESCSGACDGAMSINAPAGSLISIDGGNDFSSISTYNSICPNNYSIVVIDQNDCIATTNAIVPSGEIVQSNFIVNPGITTVIDANFNTVNYSQNGDNYYWEFDGVPVSTDFEPYIQLGDSLEAGNYPLCLITESEAGCRDTNCQIITVQSDILIYVPNTFTPDGNKFNEVFFPIITTDTELLDFEFLIFNRWGELVFESRNPNAGWDGSYGGIPSPDGTYTWKMRLVWNNENKDQDKIITGHINLLR
jgi:gliding motility-associated-like protein